jgi:hypothetical protein
VTATIPSLHHIKAISTGSFRTRVAACMRLIGINEILLKASVGIAIESLPTATAGLPLVPLITVAPWYQPFVRDIIVTPQLHPESKFLHDQQLRAQLMEPAFAPQVQTRCRAKGIFDIAWRTERLPNVWVSGRSFDSTPLSDFSSGGTTFVEDVGELSDTTVMTPLTPSVYEWDYELAVRLAVDHWRTPLPEECHNVLMMRAMESSTLTPDRQAQEYMERFPGAWKGDS